MKRVGVGILLSLFFLFPLVVMATSGCCSGHGGVDCSAGAQGDGSVICNDGWRGSSCQYSEMVMCGGASERSTSVESTTVVAPPEPKPTPTPKPKPSVKPTPTPKASPSPTPSLEPSPSPTPSPEPSPSPTSEPSPDVAGVTDETPPGTGNPLTATESPPEPDVAGAVGGLTLLGGGGYVGYRLIKAGQAKQTTEASPKIES